MQPTAGSVSDVLFRAVAWREFVKTISAVMGNDEGTDGETPMVAAFL